MAALNYWLWLTTRKGIGAKGVLRLLEQFSSPEHVYYAGQEQYDQIPGLSASGRQALLDKDLSGAEAILGDCDRLGVQIMTLQDADYPERLRQIADPPAVLYLRGRRFRFDEEAAIGVVGSRDPSPYGAQVAPRLGLELASGGALLVSGIAQGIDSLALRGALKGGGPVVSVVAGGVDVPYPYRNRFLYQDVAAVGALISEHPPGTPHKGEFFPLRNRIISGLSLGVVAVECARFSGTMKTMDHALEQDRDLFAVPGNIDAPMSQGPNWLIRQGAKPVTCGEDILDEYRDRFPQKLKASGRLAPQTVQARLEDVPREGKQTPPPGGAQAGEKEAPGLSLEQQRARFTDDQLALLHALEEKNCVADELVERTQIPARRVLSALTMLQVDGAVEELPGRRFRPLVRLARE